MVFLQIVLLCLTTAWAKRFSSPVIDPDKFTICTITINSDDEKKVFAAQAAKYPLKFNPIVELTDFGDGDWFKKSCESNIRCDQLVISGHFGGTFFGSSNKNLSLKELESAGCSKTCENVLSQPYEVFLFGCNTLSGKEEDHRTPAQYLRVLLDDGIPLEQAEMVVESRYGSIGDSHKASMQRAFSGSSKELYGFHSVGPSGKNVKSFLNNYFTKINAGQHLEKLQAKRMLGNLDWVNKELNASLSLTAFTQCETGALKDHATKSLCRLQNSTETVDQKLALTLELLGQENYLTFLPAINNFFKDNPPSNFNTAQKEFLKTITDNETLKTQILALVDKTISLGLRSEWSQFAVNLGFMTSEARMSLIKNDIAKMFEKPLTIGQRDLLCSLGPETYSSIKLTMADIKNQKLGGLDVDALRCLNQRDNGIDDLVLKRFDLMTKSDDIITFISYMTGSKQIADKMSPLVLNRIRKYLSSSNMGLYWEAENFFIEFDPKDPVLKTQVLKRMRGTDQDEKAYSLYHLGRINIQDKAIHTEMMKIISLSNNDDIVSFGTTALISCKTTDPLILEQLKKVANEKKLSEYNKKNILDYVNSVPH